MTNIVRGKMTARGLTFALVVSRVNEFVSNRLLKGAIDALIRHEAAETDIDIYWVPGSFELPFIAKKIASKKKHDAIICLGAIIKGETPHNEYIASEVTKGIAQLGMESGIPVIYGVLTTENLEQAIERAGAKAGNKGTQAAESAIEMVDLVKQIK